DPPCFKFFVSLSSYVDTDIKNIIETWSLIQINYESRGENGYDNSKLPVIGPVDSYINMIFLSICDIEVKQRDLDLIKVPRYFILGYLLSKKCNKTIDFDWANGFYTTNVVKYIAEIRKNISVTVDKLTEIVASQRTNNQQCVNFQKDLSRTHFTDIITVSVPLYIYCKTFGPLVLVSNISGAFESWKEF